MIHNAHYHVKRLSVILWTLFIQIVRVLSKIFFVRSVSDPLLSGDAREISEEDNRPVVLSVRYLNDNTDLFCLMHLRMLNLPQVYQINTLPLHLDASTINHCIALMKFSLCSLF